MIRDGCQGRRRLDRRLRSANYGYNIMEETGSDEGGQDGSEGGGEGMCEGPRTAPECEFDGFENNL